MGEYVVLFLCGLIDGITEGFEFESRRSFERKYNVDKNSFWGSKSWTRRHEKPNLYNRLFGVFDFYHVGDDLRKLGYITGGIMIGLKYNFWLALLIAWMVSVVGKRIGLHWIRN